MDNNDQEEDTLGDLPSGNEAITNQNDNQEGDHAIAEVTPSPGKKKKKAKAKTPIVDDDEVRRSFRFSKNTK